MVPFENYQDQLCNIATYVSKFAKEKGAMSGEEFIGGLQFNLNIQHEINHLFINKPTFQTCTKVDEIFGNMVNLSIPREERWDQLLEFVE